MIKIHIQIQARKVGDQHGLVRTPWSNQSVRRKCTGSGTRLIYPVKNIGIFPGYVGIG